MNTIQKLDSLNEAHVTNMELACTDMRIRLSTTYDELRSRYQMESTEQKVLRKKLEFRFSKVTQNSHLAIMKCNPMNMRLFFCTSHCPSTPCQTQCELIR